VTATTIARRGEASAARSFRAPLVSPFCSSLLPALARRRVERDCVANAPPVVGPSRTIGSTELLLEGDAVPTTTEGEPTGLQPLLNGFSRSVRAVVGRLDLAATTVWQLADGLLREHEDEYGAIAVPPLVQRSGEPRPLTRWLELVQGLLNQQAVADSKSQVIDGRLVLLGLARLDSGLDRVLRDTGGALAAGRGPGVSAS